MNPYLPEVDPSLYIEPTVAWRKWLVDEEDGLLRSLYKDVVWLPMHKTEAHCYRDRGQLIAGGRCSTAPNPRCVCGIYAVKQEDEVHRFGRARESLAAAAPSPRTLTVIGTVSLWGRIIETDRGYKAEYAYPYELHVIRDPGGFSSPSLARLETATAQASRIAAQLRDNYAVDATWR